MRNAIVSTAAAIAVAAGLGLAATPALASGGGVELPKMSWDFVGPFGTFDRAALKRGFRIYKEVCGACHSLRLMYYRNLTQIGFTEDEVKEIAAEHEVPAPPNDEGETIDGDGNRLMRPAMPSDHFVAPFPNDNAARAANNNALPPDLSLMTKARKDGLNYVYALLTGYPKDGEDEDGDLVPDTWAEEYEKEHGKPFELAEGMTFNMYFPGHGIAMGQPLFAEMVTYDDANVPQTLDQYAKDVVTFLAWTANPELEERHDLGVKAILFLIVLTALMYALKRKIWADVH